MWAGMDRSGMLTFGRPYAFITHVDTADVQMRVEESWAVTAMRARRKTYIQRAGVMLPAPGLRGVTPA